LPSGLFIGFLLWVRSVRLVGQLNGDENVERGGFCGTNGGTKLTFYLLHFSASLESSIDMT